MAQVAWHIYCPLAGPFGDPSLMPGYSIDQVHDSNTYRNYGTSGIRALPGFTYDNTVSSWNYVSNYAYIVYKKGCSGTTNRVYQIMVSMSSHGGNGVYPLQNAEFRLTYNNKKICTVHGGSERSTHTGSVCAGYLVTLTNGIQFYISFHHWHSWSSCKYPNIYGIDDTWVGVTPSAEWRRIDNLNNSNYQRLMALTIPTTQQEAVTTIATAEGYWNNLNGVLGTNTDEYARARAKYNEIINAYNDITSRDTRLLDYADKSEINSARNALVFNYSESYTNGLSDYIAIKRILAENKKTANI